MKYLFLFVLTAFSTTAFTQSVGIGTATPGEKLDVSGNIKGDTAKLNSLKIIPNAGVGKVLTSNVNGVASWQVSAVNVKALNGLSKKQDSILLGGRLLDSTRFYLSGKEIVFSDNDGVTQTVMASVTTFSPNTVLSATPITQTFKAVANYLVTSVELYLNSLPLTVTTIELKNSSEAVLSTTNFSSPVIVSGFQVFTFPQPVAINAAEMYSLSITGTAGTQMFYNVSNPYADGQCSISPTTDLAFIIKVLQENAILSIKNNRIGIGTTNPDTTFHIVGGLKITDGTEGANRIFTSNASGLGRWSSIAAPDIYGWGTSGNAGTIAANNFIGTIDYVPLNIRVNNQPSGKIDPSLKNTFWGYKSGASNTSGKSNTAVGDSAFFRNTTGTTNIAIGALALSGNTSGYSNVAIGTHALLNNTVKNNLVAIGDSTLYYNENVENTAIGSKALFANTLGYANTATGFKALNSNTTGYYNTATGRSALFRNLTGAFNTANGSFALLDNTTGNGNTANGYAALYSNTTGAFNTANGSNALRHNTLGVQNTTSGYNSLYFNTTGSGNTASGNEALYENTIGNDNTANGNSALVSNTTGNSNTAVGNSALILSTTGNRNTAVGILALPENTIGQNNTAIGYNAGEASTQSNNCTFLGANTRGIFLIQNSTAVGNGANVNISNKVRIGNSSVTLIEGQVGWSFPSDSRFKSDVKEDVPGLSLINLLNPVSYKFDTEKYQRFVSSPSAEKSVYSCEYAKSSSIKHTGFLAQELEGALKKIGYDFSGLHIPASEKDNYSIAYDNFIPILTKAIQELDAKAKAAEKANEDLKKQLLYLEERLNSFIEKK